MPQRIYVTLQNALRKGKTDNMEKSKKTALMIGGALAGVTALAAATYITTKYLVDAAIDRQMPKLIQPTEKQISGSRINQDFLKCINDSAEKLSETETEQVEITSDDGIRLVGHWYPCENAERVIVAMHGWRSSWCKDFGMIVDFWHDNKCSVLFAEQRAQNNSDGEYISFGLMERYDCLSWIRWLNENKKSDLPVYLAGISMGATTVLMAAGLGLPDNIHGIMSDCGFTSPNEIWKHVANNNLHFSYNLCGLIANEIFRKKLNMNTSDYSTLDALAGGNIPVLFVHGTDDQFVPVTMTYENYKACTAPKRLLIVPGADHGMSYYLEKEKYEQEVKAFWHDFD